VLNKAEMDELVASLVLLLKTNIWVIGGCINFSLDFLARFSLLNRNAF
jgi:hypothetical protein